MTRRRYMDSPPRVADVHSVRLGDDLTYLSVWLTLSDGSLAAIDLPLDNLVLGLYLIEPAEAPHALH